MIKVTVNNFLTLDKKTYIVESFIEAEEKVRGYFSPCDEIHLNNGRYLIHREKELIGAALFEKFYKKEDVEVKRGDIFFINLGDSDGSNLQSGVRPVVVISNNVCNNFSSVISVVALTTKDKPELPTHVHLVPDNCNRLTKKSTVLCEQIISISKDKLERRLGRVSQRNLVAINEALEKQLALDEVIEIEA